MQNGHGVAMDAQGNIYAAMGGRVPAGQTTYEGIRDVKPAMRVWGGYGSLLKFRGGVPFPRGKAYYGKEVPKVAVSEKALYIADTGNRRILKARISYRVEEEVTLP